MVGAELAGGFNLIGKPSQSVGIRQEVRLVDHLVALASVEAQPGVLLGAVRCRRKPVNQSRATSRFVEASTHVWRMCEPVDCSLHANKQAADEFATLHSDGRAVEVML